MRVEVCGSIAAGKTTLVRLLKDQGMTAVFETFNDNPFLKDFYQVEDIDTAFETEIVFILLHYNLIHKNMNTSRLVCDYSLFQDLAYAIHNLDKKGLKVFQSLFWYLNNQIGNPDLLIYLQCETGRLQRRIQKRNRGIEQKISTEYLEQNKNVLEEYIRGYTGNLLIIDSGKIDFTKENADNTQEMLSEIKMKIKDISFSLRSN